MLRYFFTIMIFCCCATAHAQSKGYEYTDTSLLKEEKNTDDTETETQVVEEVPSAQTYTTKENTGDILSDTTLYITQLTVPKDSVEKWKHDKRFAYMRNLDSLLEQKQKKELDEYNKKLKDNSNPSNSSTPTDRSASFLERVLSSSGLKIFFWTIAIAFVLFIVYRLFLSNGIFTKNTRSLPVDEIIEEEKIATVSDYDKLIHQSCKLGDYRLAVRYLFLKNLVRLAEKDYLQLSADKTDYQYVQEIRDDKKNEFSSLVLTYEYVWYGNFSLNQEAYTGIEKQYSSFYNKI